MRIRSVVTGSVLLIASLTIAAGVVRADPAGSSDAGATWVVTLGITEGPDPIPQVVWRPSNPDVTPDFDSNRRVQGDGRPDVAYDGANPVVVWAKAVGADHDIAFSGWDGRAWEPTRFLSSTVADDLDPRVFVEQDGTLHVVWWTADGSGAVIHVTRDAGAWSAPRRVTGTAPSAGRPTIAVWGGSVLVAWERSTGTGSKEIVLSSLAGDGSWSEQPLLAVNRGAPLDAVLHVERGRLWLDWKQSSSELAYTVFAGGAWSTPLVVPWPDPTWNGLSKARAAIRQAVLFR